MHYARDFIMQRFKNKLSIMALSVIIIIGVFFILQPSSNTMTKDSLKEWMRASYSRQFCEVIYPNVSSCLTMSADQCIFVANKQLQPCIDSLTANLPETIKGEDTKTIYESVSRCFEAGMHKELLEQYLIQTPECHAKFS